MAENNKKRFKIIKNILFSSCVQEAHVRLTYENDPPHPEHIHTDITEPTIYHKTPSSQVPKEGYQPLNFIMNII